MTRPNPNAFGSTAVVLAVLLACLGLAACGSSSTATSKTTTTATSANAGGQASTGRFGALRECLQKQGITLPERPSGAGQPPGGGVPGAAPRPGLQLPKGVSKAQFEAALKKCGSGRRLGPGILNGSARVQALTKFAACMRTYGVNLPPPNLSGNGPVFSIGGLNTASAQFRTARAKCLSLLSGVFGFGRARPATP